jgi:hypothetical protein
MPWQVWRVVIAVGARKAIRIHRILTLVPALAGPRVIWIGWHGGIIS